MGFKVRKCNETAPRSIGLVNFAVILRKTLSAGVMSSRKQQPEVPPELMFAASQCAGGECANIAYVVAKWLLFSC